MIDNIPGSKDLSLPESTIYVLWEEDNGEQKGWYWATVEYYSGCRGGSVAVLVIMLSKSYGMFWVQTQPCTPEWLEKKVLPLTIQCACIRLDCL